MIQMLKNKKAVLFDLDGTLIDSMWMWRQIDIDYLAKHHCELPDTLQIEIEGMSFTETAGYFKLRFGITDSVEAIQNDWLLMARDKYLHQTPLKEGARQFIQYLQERQMKLGIATSNSRELVGDVLRVHGIEEAFLAVHTCCDVPRGKPEPDIYLYVANRLGVDPKDCLVFEDIPKGLQAGNRAGMETCAVWDQHSIDQEDQKRDLANYYIRTYNDVINGTYEVLNR